jgi:pimeloyl-ACP methyl ester carboxylesterase
MNNINVFKSEEGRDKMRGYYNQILSFFPLTKKYADTSYGKTFVLEAGSDDNPAMILLHGSCSNSAAWLGDMPVLAEKYHVFAVDILGEAGNSEENRLDINEYSLWLNELLDVLGIDKAVIVGNSMGGWMALHFAAAYPSRTASLVLLAPSGIIPAKQAFLDQTADITSDPKSAESVSDAVFGDEAIPKEVREFMNLIMENFNPVTGALPVLTDEGMRKLTMPVLLVAATKDVTMDTDKAAERLSKLVPHAKVTLLEGAHVIMNAASIVMPFLSEGR